MRLPSSSRIAGSTVSDTVAAIAATTRPAYPMERTASSGKNSRPDNATATVTAEKATVRPAERMVAATAGPVAAPAANSSR